LDPPACSVREITFKARKTNNPGTNRPTDRTWHLNPGLRRGHRSRTARNRIVPNVGVVSKLRWPAVHIDCEINSTCVVCRVSSQTGLHKRHSSSQPARLDRYGSGSSRTFCIK